jgi:hypothetical protein
MERIHRMVENIFLKYYLIIFVLIGHHGFFTERNDQQKKKTKYRRNIFKKTAIGILFFITLKHRAIKKRSVSLIKIKFIHKISFSNIQFNLQLQQYIKFVFKKLLLVYIESILNLMVRYIMHCFKQ